MERTDRDGETDRDGPAGPGADHAASELTRRAFLERAGLAFGLAAAGAGLGCGGGGSLPGGAPDARRTTPLGPFDLHSHPGRLHLHGTPDDPGRAAWDATVAAARSGGLAGAFVSLVADVGVLRIDPARGPRPVRAFEPGEAWADYRRQVDGVRRLAADDVVRLATSAADPGDARILAFVAVEGGDALEGRPERVERMYEDGVRSIQLVHYTPNDLGDLQTEPARFGGLSGAGREVVREMNRLGMVVDVAHASFETVRDVVEASEQPVILSHSLLLGHSAQPMLDARLITPEHARLVAGTGGVIGAWPAGYVSRDLGEFADATLRLVDAVGVEHVGLGTDMDGAPAPVLGDYGLLGAWTDALAARGMGAGDVARVAGGNAWRVVSQVVG